MSHGSRPTLAACLGVALAKTEVFLSSLPVIPLVVVTGGGRMCSTSIRCSMVCKRTDISDSTRMVFFCAFACV